MNFDISTIGDVVVFLDAHCEVGVNWLPPLLAPIYDNPKTLTVPVIDGIQWDDFSINPVYAEGSHSRGGFSIILFYFYTISLTMTLYSNQLEEITREQKFFLSFFMFVIVLLLTTKISNYLWWEIYIARKTCELFFCLC